MFLKRSLFRLRKMSSISNLLRDACLSQSIELVTLDLWDVSSSPRLGVQPTVSHLLSFNHEWMLDFFKIFFQHLLI